jgi:outer membrane protein assembly factor BamD (BamD/ComL family)
MNRFKFLSALLITLILCIFLFSCTGIPKELPEDITVAELTREAQNKQDKGQYKAAEYYYNAAIARSINNPLELLFAEYELAHMQVKQKRFEEAKPTLERLYSYYNASENLGYPPAYKKLIEMDLAKIK